MKPDQLGLSIGIAILLAAIFLVDAQMALGFTPWLLYVIPLGLSYWVSQTYAPVVVAALSTFLMFVGYDLSPPLVPEYVALTNRMFGAITFWALAFLIVAYRLLAQRLSHLTDQLRMELMERTQDLGRAVSALRAGADHRNRPERDLPEAGDEFTRQVTDVLVAESRRLREKVGHFERGELPAPEGEDSLERARGELERLGKQLEQLQRDLLRP
jgi:hypothetical protein